MLFQKLQATTNISVMTLQFHDNLLQKLYITKCNHSRDNIIQYPPIEKGSEERQLSFNFSVVTLVKRPK